MSTLKVANIKSKTGNNSMTVADNGTITIPANLITTGNITSTNVAISSTRPMFHAYGSGTQALSGTHAWHTGQFANTWANVGSHYNTSTFTFTAPVAGMYMFWSSYAIGEDNVAGPVSYIVAGGSWRGEAIGYNDYYDNNYNSAVYALSASDTALIKFGNYNNTTCTYDLSRSYFGGCLIG